MKNNNKINIEFGDDCKPTLKAYSKSIYNAWKYTTMYYPKIISLNSLNNINMPILANTSKNLESIIKMSSAANALNLAFIYYTEPEDQREGIWQTHVCMVGKVLMSHAIKNLVP